MYILQVKDRRVWRWGIQRYETMEAAQERVQELAKVGIKARIRLEAELYR